LALAQSWAEAETAAQMKSIGKNNLGFMAKNQCHVDRKNTIPKTIGFGANEVGPEWLAAWLLGCSISAIWVICG
jgi:hypothetical protein